MADPGPLVLVVDDTPINCTVVGMQLNQLGCRALTAASGQAAIEAVASQPIDLVLMDCHMPGMDGYEAAARIRKALPPGRHLPIIALTGHDGDLDRQRSREAGMDDHLTKPLLLATLRAALGRWLGANLAQAAPAASTAPAEAGAVLDPDALASFERMRPGSSATLLGIFLKDLAAVESEVAQAVADGDLAAVGRLTHRLKGSSLTIGAMALGAAMRELGQLAREGSLPACRAGWMRTGTVLAATRSAIAERITAAPSVVSVPRPPTRQPVEVLTAQRSRLLGHAGLVACMEAMTGPAMLLNSDRQILSANRHLLRLLGHSDVSGVVGKRPGEALGCQQAASSAGGCGTAAGCAFCGAVRGVVAAVDQGEISVEEVRLLIGADSGHALDLDVTASPIDLDGQRYVLLAMRDIADEKRRQVLEQLFLHDVLNSVGGIHGLAEQLVDRTIAPETDHELRQLLARMTAQLVDEIRYQRQLIQAEAGDLQVDLRVEDAAALLREVQETYASHPAARGRRLVLGGIASLPLRTDRVLFRRVLGNLVKNALEATPEEGVVTLSCTSTGGQVRLSVHNPGAMEPAVQQQIFHRSFTTKGVGHGLGTWSAKLLGERYLGGRITFTSELHRGTELVFTLPAGS